MRRAQGNGPRPLRFSPCCGRIEEGAPQLHTGHLRKSLSSKQAGAAQPLRPGLELIQRAYAARSEERRGGKECGS